MTEKSKAPQRVRSAAEQAFLLFLSSAAALGVVVAACCHAQIRFDSGAIKAGENHNADVHKQTVENNLQSIVSDLLFLAEQNDLQELLDGGELPACVVAHA